MIGKVPWPRDVSLGIVSGLLGVVYLVAALRITPDPSSFNVLGPRVAPMTIGIATLVCSAAIIVQGVRMRSRPDTLDALDADTSDAPDARGEAPEEPDQRRSLRQLLVTFAMFAAYILVFIPLGYLLSTFAFLLALTTYIEPRRWLRNCVFAAAFAGVVYLLFTRGLRVDLPPGLLG